MTELQLLGLKIEEQRDKIISQGAQIQRMYTRCEEYSANIKKLNKTILLKNRLLKRVVK